MRRATRLWQSIRHTPGSGRDIVAIAVLVTVTMASALFIFGQYDAKAPWADERLIAAEFEKVPSVRPESRQEVRIAGVTVGRIVSAEPLPNGNARLVMSVDEDVEVYDDARAVLRSKAPINVMYVALDPGSPPADALTEDDTIPVEQTDRLVQPWELLNKLDERTQSALTSLINEADAALVSAPAGLAPGLRNTTRVMRTFEPLVEELRTRRESIRTLVSALTNVATAVGTDDTRLARLVDSLHSTLTTLGTRADELDVALAELPGFARDLRQGMDRTTALTTELDPALEGLRASSDDLPAALKRLRSTVRHADALVESAGPVITAAEPVVADLGPFIRSARPALDDLALVSRHLPSATSAITPWMNDLAAFVYQTSSAFSLSDVNGGLGRADLRIDVRNPTGGLGGDPSNDGVNPGGMR